MTVLWERVVCGMLVINNDQPYAKSWRKKKIGGDLLRLSWMNVLETFRLAAFTRDRPPSARPSRYPGSLSAVCGIITTCWIGEPSLGTNSRCEFCNCQMTSTLSSPPLSRYAPFGLNAIPPNRVCVPMHDSCRSVCGSPVHPIATPSRHSSTWI